MRPALRRARDDDFEFCARLYFSRMEEIIRELRLDMTAQATNLRERWNVAEVQIITSDGKDAGWMQSSVRGDAWSRFISAPAFSAAASAPRSSGA